MTGSSMPPEAWLSMFNGCGWCLMGVITEDHPLPWLVRQTFGTSAASRQGERKRSVLVPTLGRRKRVLPAELVGTSLEGPQDLNSELASWGEFPK